MRSLAQIPECATRSSRPKAQGLGPVPLSHLKERRGQPGSLAWCCGDLRLTAIRLPQGGVCQLSTCSVDFFASVGGCGFSPRHTGLVRTARGILTVALGLAAMFVGANAVLKNTRFWRAPSCSLPGWR